MKKLFIAATRQNDGKTSLCLGMIAGFRKMVGTIGFIKPVGQRFVITDGAKVDEDSLLIEQVYDLQSHLQDTSPIAVDRGFTERFIREGDVAPLEQRILQSFGKVSAGKDLMVIEGTGHAGVGSVFDLSNARVASLLGAKVVLVATGGIGRPIDEIVLNKALFDQAGVELVGAIINKIMPEKYEKIRELTCAGLARKNIRMLGALPYQPVLNAPTFAQVMEACAGKLISGAKNINNFCHNTVVGAMQARQALNYFKPSSLVITPGDRDDIVLAAMNMHLLCGQGAVQVAGIVLTGGLMPHPSIMTLLQMSNIPVAETDLDTFVTVTKIKEYTYKIRSGDKEKIAMIESLVGEHVDLHGILAEI